VASVVRRPSSVASTLLHRRRRPSAVVVFLRQVLGSGHTLSSRSVSRLSPDRLSHTILPDVQTDREVGLGRQGSCNGVGW